MAIYGRRTVLEALNAAAEGHLRVQEVRVSRETPKPFRQDLRSACRALGVEAIECGRREVAELSRDQRHDQGAAALVDLAHVTDAEAFAAELHGRRAARPTHLIALDGVTNPQNVGMIVRSALGAGMTGALWPLEGAPWISGLVIKASASVVLRTPIATCETLVDGLRDLRGKGFHAFGLAGDGGDDVFTHEPPHRCVYVVGSETEGLSEPVRNELDGLLSIPMSNGVESLNAAVASGVLAYAVAQRSGG